MGHSGQKRTTRPSVLASPKANDKLELLR
jgi:hypothetical protein